MFFIRFLSQQGTSHIKIMFFICFFSNNKVQAKLKFYYTLIIYEVFIHLRSLKYKENT